MSVFCPHCKQRLILEDFKIKSYYAVRDFSTCGDIVVEKKGHVVAPIKVSNLTVKGKEAKEVGKSFSLTVKGDVTEVFAGNHSEQVSKDYYVKGANVVIEGTTSITVKVGQSYIAIEAGGIKIGTTGTLELESVGQLSIKGTSGVKMESPATVDVKGTMTTVKGDGMLTLKGGVVMIN